MDEERQQLRAELEEKLNLSSEEVEPIWQRLEEKGVVEDCCWGRTSFQDLVQDARETPEYSRIETERRSRRGRPPQKLKEYFETTFDPYEEERANALSEALALQAADHHEVSAFRNDMLGRLLSPEQAHAFVTSPAVRSFRRRLFEKWGIPPVGHEATVVRTDRDVKGFRWGGSFGDIVRTGFRPWIDRYVSVYVEPPGIEKSILYGSHDIRVPEGLQVDERLSFSQNDEEDEFMRERPETVVRYPWEDRVHEVRALPDSLLDELLGLSNALTDVYGWKQEDALWFVLTGETPRISPMEVSASLLTGHRDSPPVRTITMEVSPWVSADTVKETYQELQRQIKKGDVSKGEIKEPRKLAVFRFVNEQEKVHGERPDWPILFARWNEEYPEGHEWHYADASSFGSSKKPWDTFQRDYREARKVVMDPDHHFPARKVNTRLEEWQEEDLDRRRAAAKRDLGKVITRLEGEMVDD